MDGLADLKGWGEYLRGLESELKGRLEILPTVKVTSAEGLSAIQPCDILHFSGTGNFSAEFAGRPASEMVVRVGQSSYVKIDDLRSMVKRAGSPALLVLSSDYSSPAARELARISPLTVGLQGLISAESMLHFEKVFYRALFSGDPFELAVVKGRLAMDMQHPGVRDWSLIVAYTQAADASIPLPPATLAASTRTSAFAVQPELGEADARHWRRLQRELDMHRANLAALESKMSQLSNVAGGDLESQRAELRKHIDRIESEMKKLAGN